MSYTFSRRDFMKYTVLLRHSRSGQGGSSGNWEKISVRQRWPWAGC